MYKIRKGGRIWKDFGCVENSVKKAEKQEAQLSKDSKAL